MKLKKKKKVKKKKKPHKRIIKNRITRNIRTLFKQGDYYQPKRVSDFWKNIYIEHESNGDKNKNLSLDEYLKKIKTSLEEHNNLQNSDVCKI